MKHPQYLILGAVALCLACSSTSGVGTGSEARTPNGSQADSMEGSGGMTMAEAPSLAANTPSGNQVFLLIGQSNMEGSSAAEAADEVEHERVRVLGYEAGCNDRTFNEWSPARPPLHSCWAGLGPGDSFGKIMAEAWPAATIDLVPCAISGVDIDFFVKGVVSARRSEFRIPPDNTREGAYEMVLERARIAQQTGTIAGILFHQGESDTGQSIWVDKVAGMVSDLREDLGLGEEVPFVAGELLHTGCCASHNPIINRLPDSIANAHVVSAAGLEGADTAHFDVASTRELGERYAAAMLEALDAQ